VTRRYEEAEHPVEPERRRQRREAEHPILQLQRSAGNYAIAIKHDALYLGAAASTELGELGVPG
jgi:hypothetical protein